MLNAGIDRRYVCCQRPVIHVGGELESSMLDVELRASTQELLAPLQMKANNGMLIIDDLGSQRSTAEQIFNRWIVPMEERVDHFSIGGGAYFSIPFDVVLVFSTNLAPEMLTDDALRRRLGYKIGFGPISAEAYREIWQQNCARPRPALRSRARGFRNRGAAQATRSRAAASASPRPVANGRR